MVDINKAVNELYRDLNSGRGTPYSKSPGSVSPDGIAGRLEHSLLTPDLTLDSLQRECQIARNVGAATVCVAPYYVCDASGFLRGSSTRVCAAVGFPGSLMSTEAKIADVYACVLSGAAEIDLAINVAAVKSGGFEKAEIDFRSACSAAQDRAVVKAVFEHGSYDSYEKEMVLGIISRSGVPYIKIQNMTSGHGARSEEILYIRGILGDKIKIKIDGGVKTLNQAMKLFEAGASRIGLTATKAVADEANKWR